MTKSVFLFLTKTGIHMEEEGGDASGVQSQRCVFEISTPVSARWGAGSKPLKSLPTALFTCAFLVNSKNKTVSR